MVFNWALFISLARELLDGEIQILNPREEYLRTIISRFYYGVFCIAKNYKESQGCDFPEEKIHLYVRNAYIDSSDGDENSIGKNLLTLWRKRVISDYRDYMDVNLFEARAARQLAHNIFEKLKKVGAVPQKQGQR